MPELVVDGPTIPVHLLNELDSGRVVFFCGAGISAGPGSGLPRFGDLVKHVYEANHMEPDVVEREALDLDEQDDERRRPNLEGPRRAAARRPGPQVPRELTPRRREGPRNSGLAG